MQQKVSLCTFYGKGKCDRGGFCGFAHGLHEIGQRRVADAMQLPVCKDFKRGWCNRGGRCKYHHDEPSPPIQHKRPCESDPIDQIAERKRPRKPDPHNLRHVSPPRVHAPESEAGDSSSSYSETESRSAAVDSDSGDNADDSETQSSYASEAESYAVRKQKIMQKIMQTAWNADDEVEKAVFGYAFDRLRSFFASRHTRMWRSQQEGLRATLAPCKITYDMQWQTWWIVCECQQSGWRLSSIPWWDETNNRPFCTSCRWPLPVRVEAWHAR